MLVVCLRLCVVRVPRSHTLTSHTNGKMYLMNNCEFTYPGLCTMLRVLLLCCEFAQPSPFSTLPATTGTCKKLWIHISGPLINVPCCEFAASMWKLDRNWIHISGYFYPFAICNFAPCFELRLYEFTYPGIYSKGFANLHIVNLQFTAYVYPQLPTCCKCEKQATGTGCWWIHISGSFAQVPVNTTEHGSKQQSSSCLHHPLSIIHHPLSIIIDYALPEQSKLRIRLNFYCPHSH